MILGRVLVLAFWFAACAVANSAEFSVLNSKDSKTRIDLVGPIEPGDADKLRNIIQAANSAARVVVTIRLNSAGGNLLEGVSLADLIRKARLQTSVLSGSQCASACFIIFAAGSEKFAHFSALIGVHGASDENGEETILSGAATVGMARVVKTLGVPASVIGKMVVTPPDKIVWLNLDDLRAMDVKMFGKPQQLSPSPSSEAQLPMQLSPKIQNEPKVQANAPAAPSWEDFIKKASQVSAEQNNGRVQYARVCQPEHKTCVSGLSYKTKSGDEIAKVTEDLNGKIVSREICRFNKFGDVRSCFDWDAGTTRKDMKNIKGDWYKVSD